MNILFVHQNFPGQFKHLAPKLASLGHNVTAFILGSGTKQTWRGIQLVPYQIDRGNSPDVHPWVTDFESKIIRGEACMRAATKLRNSGYTPDIIIAHPGWGESLFLKEVWPDVRLKIYCEYYYAARGADVGFDTEFKLPADSLDSARVILKNANILLHADSAYSCISPTNWQANTFPPHIKKKITTIHDGIDTNRLKPDNKAHTEVANLLNLSTSDPLITFVSRTLEPYRGFHTLMRALPKILTENENARVLIIGQESGGYGAPPRSSETWKAKYSKEITEKLDQNTLGRIHFLGKVDYDFFIKILQASTVHIYLTYPFVLSWSLLEAMSIGCAIIASNTEPVLDVVADSETGLLTDFFDSPALAQKVSVLLNSPQERNRLGENARKFIVDTYDLDGFCLPRQIEWALD